MWMSKLFPQFSSGHLAMSGTEAEDDPSLRATTNRKEVRPKAKRSAVGQLYTDKE